MSRKSDDDDKLHFQMDRFLQQNGEWFYTTREGEERGPFATKEDAEGDLLAFILELQKLDKFGQ